MSLLRMGLGLGGFIGDLSPTVVGIIIISIQFIMNEDEEDFV